MAHRNYHIFSCVMRFVSFRRVFRCFGFGAAGSDPLFTTISAFSTSHARYRTNARASGVCQSALQDNKALKVLGYERHDISRSRGYVIHPITRSGVTYNKVQTFDFILSDDQNIDSNVKGTSGRGLFENERHSYDKHGWISSIPDPRNSAHQYSSEDENSTNAMFEAMYRTERGNYQF